MLDILFTTPFSPPPGWRITPPSERMFNSQFSPMLQIGDAARFLVEELQLLGGGTVTVSSGYQHLNNERLRKKVTADPSVAIAIKFEGKMHHLACDKWSIVEQNLYSLHLALRAMRNIEEWGIASFRRQLLAFMPPARASSPSSVMPEWMVSLGLGPTATLDDAQAVYRRRAKLIAHDEQALMALNNAMDQAKDALG